MPKAVNISMSLSYFFISKALEHTQNMGEICLSLPEGEQLAARRDRVLTLANQTTTAQKHSNMYYDNQPQTILPCWNIFVSLD